MRWVADGGGARRVRARSEARRRAAPPSGRPTPSRPRRAPRRVILFIGTSLTAGLGLDPDQAFPAVVARRLDSLRENYEVVNAGVSGETSADARRRLGWLLRRPAAVIVARDRRQRRPARPRPRRPAGEHPGDHRHHPRRPARGARIILAGMEAPPNMGPQYHEGVPRDLPAAREAERAHADPLPADGRRRRRHAQSGRRDPPQRARGGDRRDERPAGARSRCSPPCRRRRHRPRPSG